LSDFESLDYRFVLSPSSSVVQPSRVSLDTSDVDWLKSSPKMHSTVTGTDPSPASHPFIDDVLCEHGGLAADVKKRRMISLEVSRSVVDPTSFLTDRSIERITGCEDSTR